MDLTDVSRMTLIHELEPKLSLYTAVVWSLSLKRKVRLAYLLDCRDPNRVGRVLLFSTDLEIEPSEILDFYKARFQIEFIFRDAKQFTGLSDCQARDLTKLDFHFNACLTALNLARFDAFHFYQSANPFIFSMASYKRLALNHHLLDRFTSLLDLEPTSIKSHPNFPNLYPYGAIATNSVRSIGPDLNAIEMLWSKLKSFIKKLQPRTTEELDQAVSNFVNSLVSEDVLGYFLETSICTSSI